MSGKFVAIMPSGGWCIYTGNEEEPRRVPLVGWALNEAGEVVPLTVSGNEVIDATWVLDGDNVLTPYDNDNSL